MCWVSFDMMGYSSEALWVIHLKAEVQLWRVLICVGSTGSVSVGDKKQMQGRGPENCRDGAGRGPGAMEGCRSQKGH